MYSLILFLSFFSNLCYGYKLCVFGATSGLGRELVYQASLDRNMSVLALSGTSRHLTVPCRVNSFQDIQNQPPFQNPNMIRGNYWEDLSSYDYEAAIFTTQSAPFQDDYSDTLLAKVLPSLPPSCQHIVLVSAHECTADVTNNWHNAKKNQETLLHLKVFEQKYPYLKKTIFRPRALTYGSTTLPSVTRQAFAGEILQCILTNDVYND